MCRQGGQFVLSSDNVGSLPAAGSAIGKRPDARLSRGRRLDRSRHPRQPSYRQGSGHGAPIKIARRSDTLKSAGGSARRGLRVIEDRAEAPVVPVGTELR